MISVIVAILPLSGTLNIMQITSSNTTAMTIPAGEKRKFTR